MTVVLRLALLAGALVLAVPAGGGAIPAGGTAEVGGAAAASARSFVLAEGDAAFWSGPPDEPGDCGPGCWAYAIDVTERGHQLRVGIDRPRLGDVWEVDVLRPDGSVVGSFSPGTELYSAELVELDPDVGVYGVLVRAEDVDDVRFRMRAALDADNRLPAAREAVPPDLQPLPPWDFSFLLPVTNGTVAGASTGVAVPTGRVACHAEEVVLYEAVRCLRMSFGVVNTGLGPLELVVGSGQPYQDRPLLQRVRFSDGETAEVRGAGNAYFHHSHLHYHHDDAIGLELLRVVDPETGALESAGEPHRKGFAHRNELLREWTRFYPVWPKRAFGLMPGWGDYYEWDRPGNYVDFGLNGDGLYVVRITADPDGFMLETDPDDNVAYSLIRVAGDQVEHLESGRGTDPWDRCRTPLPLGPEFEDSYELPAPRPDDCAG